MLFPRQPTETSSQAIRTRDPAALRPLVEDHIDPLFAFVFHRVDRDRTAAAEVVQETFLHALRAAPRFRGESTAWTWICGIARKLILGRRRAAPLPRGPRRQGTGPAAGRGAITGLGALGALAARPLGAFLANRTTTPDAAGRAASVLANLGAEHHETVQRELRSSLQAALGVFEDPLAQEADRDGTRKKTGSLAWLAGQRAAAEHDQLAQVLVESLLRTKDEPQAGTLVWGLGRLSGLGLHERLRSARALLQALPGQRNGGLAHAQVRAVKALLAGVAATEVTPLIDELAMIHANDPKVTAMLNKLRTELVPR
ncbi:MAG TPA: sigma factor [Planctomycetota bacterium]